MEILVCVKRVPDSSENEIELNSAGNDIERDDLVYSINEPDNYAVEEALQIIVPLLHTGHIDFEGKYYQARECELRPRGPRPNGPPILIGTFGGSRMLRLTAQYADLWNAWAANTGNSPEGVREYRTALDAACAEIGRDPATLGRTVAVFADFPGSYGRPGQTVPSLTGTPEEMAEEMRAYAREGISHVQIYPDPCTVAGIEAFAPVLEILDRG